jgi:hypothetical protein
LVGAEVLGIYRAAFGDAGGSNYQSIIIIDSKSPSEFERKINVRRGNGMYVVPLPKLDPSNRLFVRHMVAALVQLGGHQVEKYKPRAHFVQRILRKKIKKALPQKTFRKRLSAFSGFALLLALRGYIIATISPT